MSITKAFDERGYYLVNNDNHCLIGGKNRCLTSGKSRCSAVIRYMILLFALDVSQVGLGGVLCIYSLPVGSTPLNACLFLGVVHSDFGFFFPSLYIALLIF